MGASMLIAASKAPVYENQDDPRNQPEFVTDLDQIKTRITQADYIKWAREILLEDDGNRWYSMLPDHVAERLEEGITDLIPRDEHGAPEYTEEEFDWSAIFTDTQVAKVVEQAVTDVLENERDTAWIPFGDRWYILSGGLSHSDAPTDACEPLWLLGELGLFDDPFPRP